MMNASQKKRLIILSLIGSICAGITATTLSIIANTNTRHQYSSENLLFGFFGFIATLVVIQIMWKIMIKRKVETKRRGTKYGAFAGFLALFMTMTFTSYYYAEPSAIENQLFTVLIILPIIMTIFGFIFFGFLAPLFGALLGYIFSRDLEN